MGPQRRNGELQPLGRTLDFLASQSDKAAARVPQASEHSLRGSTPGSDGIDCVLGRAAPQASSGAQGGAPPELLLPIDSGRRHMLE
jgi:hypothetical protein